MDEELSDPPQPVCNEVFVAAFSFTLCFGVPESHDETNQMSLF